MKPLPEAFTEKLKQLDVVPVYDGEQWRFNHQDRQLKAIFNPAVIADLERFHNIDGEKEVLSCVLEMIQFELDAARGVYPSWFPNPNG